jgi:hypothetical protein
MSDPRTRRLAADQKSVRDRFSGHPHVEIETFGGTPPHRYRVTYRLKGLRRDGERPRLAQEHVCEIELPRGYPRDAPRVVAVTPVFHPNISGIYCIGDYWAPVQDLADIIEKIGDMIQWRTYSTTSALDPVAAKYGEKHPELFPVGDVVLGLPEPEIAIGVNIKGSSPDSAPDES